MLTCIFVKVSDITGDHFIIKIHFTVYLLQQITNCLLMIYTNAAICENAQITSNLLHLLHNFTLVAWVTSPNS